MVIEGQQRVENEQEATGTVDLVIYVAQHCAVCAYAHEVAADIEARFPTVNLRIVDVQTSDEAIPESVFATPTYLLNGRVWSLGNPSDILISDTFDDLT